jgi:hypothetical protein
MFCYLNSAAVYGYLIMKKIVLLVFFSMLGSYLHAQQRPAVKKDWIEAKGEKRKMVTVPRQKLISTAVKEEYLIVIDNRIFESDAAAFARVPKDSLQLVNTIRDSLSTSNIKMIRIYKRK